MFYKALTAVPGLLVGGWMIFDGIHVMATGKYFGPEKPGPWSALPARLGVDPYHLGPLFVLLGVLWLTALIALLAGQRWGWYAGIVVAAASLWYVPLGTVLSALYLVLLLAGQARLRPPT